MQSIVLFTVLASLALPAFAQDAPPSEREEIPTVPAEVRDRRGHISDFNEFMHETQIQTPDPDRVTSVWWLPREFWEWSFSQDETLTDEGAAQLLGILLPYTMVAAVDGTIGPLGGITFVDPKELSDRVELVDAKGGRHRPLSGDSLSADAVNLVGMVKTLLANILGPAGENMGVFVFPAATSDGEPIASATMEGAFSVEVGDKVFQWKTPLGSVLPRKVCPVDGEELSGAWSYCPWHGKKLVPRKAK